MMDVKIILIGENIGIREILFKNYAKCMNMYLHNKCCNTSTNGKAFWEAVKPLISHKCINKNDIILLQEDNVVTQQNVVVTHSNEYFTNMAMNIGPDDSVDNNDVVSCTVKHEGHDSIQNIRKLMETAHITDAFYFHNIYVDTGRFHLQKLNCKKATG
jgi:hypothetical protein